MSTGWAYPAALSVAGLVIAALLVVLVRRRQVRVQLRVGRVPPASAMLGVAGLVAYPVVVTGLALAIGDRFGAVAGWAVATVGVVTVAVPRLLRELDDRPATPAPVQLPPRAVPPP